MEQEVEKVLDQVQNFINFVANKTKKVSKSKDTWSREEVMRLMYDMQVQSEGLRHFIDVREKRRMAEEEARLKAERKAKLDAQLKEWEEKMRQPKKPAALTYNTKCRHHITQINQTTGEEKHLCDIEYPLESCGDTCPYATNMICSTRAQAPKRRSII